MNDLNDNKIINTWSREELVRYARHGSLPEIGWSGQQSLKAARVLVVGAGGLGSPVLLYLAAAGVGYIGIIDGDVVDASNLQRQVLYTLADVGKPKAEVAKARLEALNPHIVVQAYPFALTRDNALDLIKAYDVVADGTDNFATRYLVNDACVLAGKVNVYASVSRFTGQVAVFNYRYADGSRSANYRDVFPRPPAAGTVLSCAEEGILGVLPGMVGSMQAGEIIKLITGFGEPLHSKLALFDAATLALRVIQLPPATQVTITALIDYDLFCNASTFSEHNSISPAQLRQWIKAGKNLQLIDVRQPAEHEHYHIGGSCIPLSQIEQVIPLLHPNITTILYCQSGSRSERAWHTLREQGETAPLLSLEGGVNAWLATSLTENGTPEIDRSDTHEDATSITS